MHIHVITETHVHASAYIHDMYTSAYFFACDKGMGKGETVVKNFNFLHNTYQMDDPYIPMYYTYRHIHTYIHTHIE